MNLVDSEDGYWLKSGPPLDCYFHHWLIAPYPCGMPCIVRPHEQLVSWESFPAGPLTHWAAIWFHIRVIVYSRPNCGSTLFSLIDRVSIDLCPHTGPGCRTRKSRLSIQSCLWYLSAVRAQDHGSAAFPKGLKSGPAPFALIKTQNMPIHSEGINRGWGDRGRDGQMKRYPRQVDLCSLSWQFQWAFFSQFPPTMKEVPFYPHEHTSDCRVHLVDEEAI